MVPKTMITSRYEQPWREEGPQLDPVPPTIKQKGKNTMKILIFAIGMCALAVIFFMWLAVTHDNREIQSRIAEIEELEGGDWYYDANDGYFKDFLTDRKIKA